jgi:hypothetical protein
MALKKFNIREPEWGCQRGGAADKNCAKNVRGGYRGPSTA